MRFWREVTADRYSGGLLGVLLALSFAFQTLLAGWAAAAMVAPDTLGVICSSSPDGPAHPDGPGDRHECPCSRLCGAGIQAQGALAPPDGSTLPIRFTDRIEFAVARSHAPFEGPVVRRYHARAPPPIRETT